MATGYTACVQDGTVTELRDFALQCARAFGANIPMRDEPHDAPIKTYVPDEYYRKRVDEARAALDIAEKRTVAEAEAMRAKRVEEERTSRHVSQAKDDITRKNYEAMLDKVVGWNPPTKDHDALKDFMLRQLRESIKWDCTATPGYDDRHIPRGEDYRQLLLKRARQELRAADQAWEGEQDKVRERNEWNRALVASL